MKRSRTPRRLPRLGLAGVAFWAGWIFLPGHSAYGQVSIEPVIEPSPFIAQGHLEGGINGEGLPRPDGKTPLMLAVEAEDLKVIGYLLQHGADPETKDAAGETALDLARRRPDHAAADRLNTETSAHPGFVAYYSDRSPLLAAVSARAQSGSPGCAAAHAVVVRVRGADGKPLVDAPVRFQVEGGGKYLLTQASSPDSPSLLLRSDEAGECRANINLPREPNTRIHIVASVGTGERASQVTFTALTNDGTGGTSSSCYDPTDVVAQGDPDGSADVTWQNQTDDETAIKVFVRTLDGWKPVLTLPPHSTSAHLPR